MHGQRARARSQRNGSHVKAGDEHEPTEIVVSFVMYDDGATTILVESPCALHATVHTHRLALSAHDGASCMGAVVRLLARHDFVGSAVNVDDAIAFAIDVLDDIGGI